MQHLKGKSQKPNIDCRTVSYKKAREDCTKNLQNERNKIGMTILGTAVTQRKRKSTSQSNTSSIGRSSITSSCRTRSRSNRNSNQQQNNKEIDSLTKIRNAIPCMTSIDRVTNWKALPECTDLDFYRKDVPANVLQSGQRSSIQERICYEKVTSTPNTNDFKVPATIQRMNSRFLIDVIDLTVDESTDLTKSSQSASQEELYSYLGVVTKSQTNKVENETDNKTVKRSSLRVKVKQIALRNQEKYNQLTSGKKLAATDNKTSIAATNNSHAPVRFNGNMQQFTIRDAAKQQRNNGVLHANKFNNNHHNGTPSTYRAATLLKNKSNVMNTTQQQKTNTNRQGQYKSSLQMIPYSFNHSFGARNPTNKCMVIERCDYKRSHEPDNIPQVNVKKYKSSNMVSNTATDNHISSGQVNTVPQRPVVSQTGTNKKELTSIRRAHTMTKRPPDITLEVQRLAREQFIALHNSAHSTSSNSRKNCNIQSAPTRQHRTSNSMITTKQQVPYCTNTATFKSYSLESSTRSNNAVSQHINSLRTVTTNSQAKINQYNVSSQSEIQNVDAKKDILQQGLQNNRSSNALSVQTCSQKNIGNNKHTLSSRIDIAVKEAIEIHKQIQNVNSGKITKLQKHSMPNNDTNNILSLPKYSQKYIDTSLFRNAVNLDSKRDSSGLATENIDTLPLICQRGNSIKREDAQSNRLATSPSTSSIHTSSQSITSKDMILLAQKKSQENSSTYVPLHLNVRNIVTNTVAQQVQSIENNDPSNELLSATSLGSNNDILIPKTLGNELEITIASKDLNENVSKDNKPYSIDELETANAVLESETTMESKTNSVDDVKPNLTLSPFSCEDSKLLTEALNDKSSSSFLLKKNGEILSVLSFDEQYVIVQEKLISFWSLPSVLFSIFGMQQEKVCIGKIERYNCDIEIDTPYQYRLLVVGNKTNYIELRAKQLTGAYTRESLMSIYLTVYSFNEEQELTLRHIEFDRVHGSLHSIRYAILPNTRSFVVSWFELATHVRKYNLNSNASNLESVLVFPDVFEHVTSLRFLENDKIIGFGYSAITIWNGHTGDITCKIDTKLQIGDNLTFFSLNENTERVLFLVQMFTSPGEAIQLIKLIAINMNENYTWKVISTHEMPSNCTKIASTEIITSHFITTYDNGQSFLLNLYNPRQFIVCPSQARESKLFVTNGKLIIIDNNQFSARTLVDHFIG